MKKLIAMLLALAMVLALTACGGSSAPAETKAPEAAAPAETEAAPVEEAKTYKVGFSFYNLSNPVWAEVVDEATVYGKSLGLEVNYVDCGQDAQKQISQIETFIMGEYDAIVILPIDPAAVVDVVQEAKDAGIHVLSYSTDFEGAETNLALDPDSCGAALADMAAEFIKEKYPDGKFDWVFEDIPSIELGVLEGKAVEKRMLELFPESNLLGNAEVLTTEEGVNVTENFMQAYPDCRVFLGISAGVGTGGNEAIKTAVPESEWGDYLLFSVDATEQECDNIINGEVLKGSIGLGGGRDHGRIMVDLAVKLLNGEPVDRYTGLPPTAVTAANAVEYKTNTYGG